MNYRSLLVHLDDDPRCGDRTRIGIQLARRFGCKLVGLAPTGLLDLPGTLQGAAHLASYAEDGWESLWLRANRARLAFTNSCVQAGVERFDTLIEEAEQTDSLLNHGHCNDLTIMGQPDPDEADWPQLSAMIDRHVLLSAMPTLIVPYAGHLSTLGERVLVAWNGSRESSRALLDALPFLRRAADVRVVCWTEPADPQRVVPGSPLERLKAYLALQGVEAEVSFESTDMDVDATLLSRAADWSSDLIVMGAYGKSPLKERWLGGATRSILGSMTVPVLMSH